MRDSLASLTIRGRAFIAAGVTTTVCSILLGFDALMRVGILAVALPLITAIWVGRTRYRLMAARTVQPSRVSMGDTAQVRVDLVNRGKLPVGMLLFEDRVPPSLGPSVRFTVDRMGAAWRRSVSYEVQASQRGHYELGPLGVRISDPFGFIALSRSFSTTSAIAVVPRVEGLTPLPLSGGASHAGDRQLRSSPSGSAEDVTVREYRQGDDLRRVHWRSTARVGSLMVRREERQWQNRATLLLDTRHRAHAGTGADSSVEWAISAAASVGVHLEKSGYAVRLLTERHEPDATQWHAHLAGASERASLLLDQLSALTLTPLGALREATANLTSEPGLTVAVLGACTPQDLEDLGVHLPPRTRKLALLLDTSQWASRPVSPSVEEQRVALARRGWQVSVAVPGASVDSVWRALPTHAGHHRRAAVPAQGRA